jgi:cytochrome c2
MVGVAASLSAPPASAQTEGLKDNVIDTVHDIGDGIDGGPCTTCHDMHNSNTSGPLLWARDIGTTDFTTYTGGIGVTRRNSGTLGVPGTLTDPAWKSYLCMSCHDDATITAGSYLNQPDKTDATIFIARNTSLPITPTPVTTFTTTITGKSHPVDVVYDDTAANADMATATEAETAGVKFFLDPAASDVETLQCATCHDPHEANYNGQGASPITAATLTQADRTFFIRNQLDPITGELCLSCHN